MVPNPFPWRAESRGIYGVHVKPTQNTLTPHVPRDNGELPPNELQDILSCVQLWAAVLKSAVQDVWSSEPTARARAKAWFRSDATTVGSVNWICDSLNLEVEDIRNRATGD